MPTINEEKCFEQPSRNILNETQPDETQPVSNWFSWIKNQTFPLDVSIDAYQLFHKLSSISELSQENIQANLNALIKHIGKNSTYTQKQTLVNSLQWLNNNFDKPEINIDTKKAAAFKFMEDISACTPGFHNRVNEIIFSFSQPKNSISEFLEQFRKYIITTTAASHTGDVHTTNRFFILAADKYKVQPTHPDDIYSGYLSDDVINKALKESFETKYQFWGILNFLYDKLNGNLRAYGAYKGQNADGYDHGDYEKMLSYLETFIGKSESFAELLILSEDDKVIDLNWPNIMNKLWQKLTNESFFSYTDTEKQLYAALFNPDSPSNIIDFLLTEDNILPQNLFTNFSQALIFLDECNWLPHDKKLAFCSSYLNSMHSDLTKEELRKLVLAIFNKQNFCIDMFDKIPVLSQLIQDNKLVFDIADKEPRILELIGNLTYSEQIAFYAQENYYQVKIYLLLSELDKKRKFYQSSQQKDLADAISSLNTQLKLNLKKYLASENKEASLDAVERDSMAAILEAKKSIIQEYPDVTEIILRIVCLLSGIGTLIMLAQACVNYSNNNSLFFPSNTEKKLRECEKIISESCKINPF